MFHRRNTREKGAQLQRKHTNKKCLQYLACKVCVYIVNSTIFSILVQKREGLVCSVGCEKLVGRGGIFFRRAVTLWQVFDSEVHSLALRKLTHSWFRQSISAPRVQSIISISLPSACEWNVVGVETPTPKSRLLCCLDSERGGVETRARLISVNAASRCQSWILF